MRNDLLEKMIPVFVLVACLGLMPSRASGEATVPLEEMLDLPLEEILDIQVVSPARYAQKIWESPSTIYVITAEDIRNSGLTSIPDLLRSVPGLDVLTVSATQSEVAARGLAHAPSNKMLVMIDGRSVYNNSYNLVLWNSLPVVLDDVKQIEVILGPGSALYGANAFNGIIHIITKSPEEARTVHLSGGLGSGHTRQFSLLHGGRWKRLGWKVFGGWNETDRWTGEQDLSWLDAFVGLNVSDFIGTTRGPGQSGDLLTLGGSLQLSFDTETFLSLSGGLSQGALELLASPEAGFYDTETDTEYLTLDFRHRDLHLQLSYDQGRLDMESLQMPQFFAPSRIDYRTVDIQACQSLDPVTWFKLTLGGNYRFNEIDWDLMARKHRFSDVSGFLQGVFFSRESVSLTLGTRYDRYDIVGDRWSWRASLIYGFLGVHSVRCSYGSAFRNPSYLETYMYGNWEFLPGMGMVSSGNTELDPESVDTVEMEYLGTLLQRRLQLRMTCFYNRYRDFIYSRVVESHPLLLYPTLIKFFNFGGARALGAELAMDAQWTDRIRMYASYSFQRLHFTDDDPYTPEDEEDRRIRSSPAHKVNAGFTACLGKGLTGDVSAHFVGKTSWEANLFSPINKALDPYVLVNARLGYRFLGDRAEMAVAGYNLLFDEHREYPVGDEIGTRVLCTLRVDY